MYTKHNLVGSEFPDNEDIPGLMSLVVYPYLCFLVCIVLGSVKENRNLFFGKVEKIKF